MNCIKPLKSLVCFCTLGGGDYISVCTVWYKSTQRTGAHRCQNKATLTNKAASEASQKLFSGYVWTWRKDQPINNVSSACC